MSFAQRLAFMSLVAFSIMNTTAFARSASLSISCRSESVSVHLLLTHRGDSLKGSFVTEDGVTHAVSVGGHLGGSYGYKGPYVVSIDGGIRNYHFFLFNTDIQSTGEGANYLRGQVNFPVKGQADFRGMVDCSVRYL